MEIVFNLMLAFISPSLLLLLPILFSSLDFAFFFFFFSSPFLSSILSLFLSFISFPPPLNYVLSTLLSYLIFHSLKCFILFYFFFFIPPPTSGYSLKNITRQSDMKKKRCQKLGSASLFISRYQGHVICLICDKQYKFLKLESFILQCNPDIRETWIIRYFLWSQIRACVNVYKIDQIRI